MVKTKFELPKEKLEVLEQINNLRLLGPCSRYSNSLNEVLEIAKNVRINCSPTSEKSEQLPYRCKKSRDNQSIF
jgi:hypothetical protein